MLRETPSGTGANRVVRRKFCPQIQLRKSPHVADNKRNAFLKTNAPSLQDFSCLTIRRRIGNLPGTLSRGAPACDCSPHGVGFRGRERLMPRRDTHSRINQYYVHSGIIWHPIETKKLSRVDLQKDSQCVKWLCSSNDS